MANTAHFRMTVGLGLGLLQYDTMLLLEPPSYIHQHQKTTWVYGKLQRGVFVPLDPQPAAKEVVVMRRAYATLKRDSNYKRRVT